MHDGMASLPDLTEPQLPDEKINSVFMDLFFKLASIHIIQSRAVLLAEKINKWIYFE